MKRENLAVNLQAVWLSWLLTFGALGSMITGLNLNVAHFSRLALLWAAVCLMTALVSRSRFGGWLLLAAAVGAGVYLVRGEDCLEQTLEMLCKISNYYDNAYGWGMIRSARMGRGPMDRPLAILGIWIAMALCRTLCTGRSGLWALSLAALPLVASVVVIDTVPDSLYLYCWLLGLVLVLLSRNVRRRQPEGAVRLIRAAAVPAALALALLFWAVPREGYDKHPDELQDRIVAWVQELPDLWERASREVASFVDGTIQPESVSLDTLGPRVERVYPVMDVTAPVSGTVYLRGQHYDTYTGTGWTVSEDSEEFFSGPADTRELGTITISTRRVRDVIYLPYYPESPQVLREGSVDNDGKEKVCSFALRGLDSHWRNLVAVMDSSNIPLLQRKNAQKVNLELPSDTYEWAVEKLDAILSGETTATAVADSVAQYVRGSALYDLNTQRMDRTQDDFARWFLEESDTGYCVHFATAAVVLLRAAGVEARYVEGYMFTSVKSEPTTVTADQAHAWAEYYEPLLDAWIVLEATPADLGGEAQPETQGAEVPLPVQTEPETPTESDGASRPLEDEQRPGLPEAPGEDMPEEKIPDLSWLWKALLRCLIPVLAVLVAVGQRLLRLARRDRLRQKGSANARALFLWRELERLHRLLKTEPPAAAREIALKAKYSPYAISWEELAELEAFRQNALAEMEKRQWYLKFLDRFVFAAY